jgi:hypothetical protein
VQSGSSAGDEAARSLRAAEELRRKAARLEERAAAFARGRQGELSVARALDQLAADGYARIDDCRWPGRPQANIDHVLVGPAGLFVIDAKNWSGRVEVRDGVLRQNGYRRTREAEASAEAARAVAGLLPMGVARVEGVLCLCGEAQLPATQLPPSAFVVSVAQICDWMRRQPALLTPAAAAAVHGELLPRLEPASRTAAESAASSVPDFVPEQWPAGPVRREPPAPARAPRSGRSRLTPAPAPPRRHRFSKRAAIVGRVILLLMLDAVGTAAVSANNRAGDVIVFVVCLAWLVRLERRRPTLTGLRR